ncbi:unknow [Vibrio campbellii]|nr:unknow [Vibrio campbellii]
MFSTTVSFIALNPFKAILFLIFISWMAVLNTKIAIQFIPLILTLYQPIFGLKIHFSHRISNSFYSPQQCSPTQPKALIK